MSEEGTPHARRPAGAGRGSSPLPPFGNAPHPILTPHSSRCPADRLYIPGFALGVLLTLALQMAVRWAARYRWARELLQALDLTIMQPDGQLGTTAEVAGSTFGAGGTVGAGTSGRGQGMDGSGSLAVRLFATAMVRYLGLLLRRMKRIWIWFWIWDRPSGKIWEGLDGWSAPGGAAAVGDTSTSGALPKQQAISAQGGASSATSASAAAGGDLVDVGESVEWVNMCWRKVKGGGGGGFWREGGGGRG